MERVDYSKLNYEVKVEGGNLAPFVPPLKGSDSLNPLGSIIEEQAKQIEKSQQDFDDYKKTMEARFDKLATMLQALGGSK
jgi:hypothetical protein